MESLNLINRIENVVNELSNVEIIKNWRYDPGQTEPIFIPLYLNHYDLHLKVNDIHVTNSYEFSLQLIGEKQEIENGYKYEGGEVYVFNVETIPQVEEMIREFLMENSYQPA